MATELGVAYVTVMPSMKGFSKSLASSLQSSGTSGGKSFTSGFLSSVKGTAIGTALGGALSKAVDAVAGSLSSAISRVDTMGNFPKIMANMGISADASQAAISRLSAGIDGLPTRLDDAVSATTRFVSKSGDIGKSTDYFLAVNDAILAGGAASEIQASALEQLSQSYSKGRMDMTEWRSLQMAMPAQLNQVARAMGMTTDALGEGLRTGKVSMDDFMDTIVRLDSEGVDGLASFQEQAQTSSAGIGTAMQNMQNRVGKAVAKVIEHIGQANIAGAINSFSSSFSGIADGVIYAMDRVAAAIDLDAILASLDAGVIATRLAGLPGTLKAAFDPVADAVGTALTRVGEAVGPLVSELAESLPQAINAVSPLLASLASLVGDKLALALSALAPLVEPTAGAFDRLCGAARFVVDALDGVYASARGSIEPLGGVFGEVFDAIADLVDGVSESFGGFLDAIQPAVGAIGDFLSGEGPAFNSMMDRIRGHLDDLSPAIDALKGAFAALFDALAPVVNAVAPLLVEFVGNLVSGLVGLLPILAQVAAAVVQFVADVIQGAVQVATGIATWAAQAYATVESVWNQISSTVSGAVKAVASFVSGAWRTIQSVTSNVWNAIRGAISSVVGGIRTTVTSILNAMASGVASIWNGIRSTATSVWNGIKSAISGVVNGISSAVSGAFNALRGTVSGIFNGIRSAIVDPVNTARDLVRGAVDAIKGIFNFQISWPHIPLPHFSISGSANPLDWLTQGVPKISISWYAKGGIVDGASLIGVGERGRELVVPAENERYMEPFARATARNMGMGEVVAAIERLERDMGPIIREYAPRTASREYARGVRRAMA